MLHDPPDMQASSRIHVSYPAVKYSVSILSFSACLPTGKLGENELQPGQQYSTSSFKFQCVSNGDLSLSYDVICKIIFLGLL